MRIRLEVSQPNGTRRSLIRAIRRQERKLDNAADALGDFRRAFRNVDRRLDTQIKRKFRSNSWAALSEETIDSRDAGYGWYRQPGSLTIKPGRWTDKMYASLLGFAPQGGKLFSTHGYSRVYNLDGEYFDGRDVAKRALWFHEGTRKQPARPFWDEGEREIIAKQEIDSFVSKQITSKLGA